jgi:hypothetical protein
MLETALGRKMQKRLKLSIVCVAGALLSLVGTGPLRAADPTVAGFWEAYDEGKPGGWFLFFERDGLFQGAIVKAFNKPGEQPQLTCSKCTDERKNQPMIGMSIVKGMQRKGLVYENGTILDPRDGSVYKAKMELSPDAKQLSVRGFLGIELFGQSQIWKRLPDNVMPINEIPEELRPFVAAAAPAVAPKPANGAKPAPAAGTTRNTPGSATHPAGSARNAPGAAPHPQQPPPLRRQQQN